ncbi:MAG TPA: MFS transporter, partial [Pyrinomonadaceae bacterium]|nr:MFS transporter [Pyrinomonadaceae bacterium]
MSSAQETAPARAGARRGPSLFVFTLLAVEFLDELVFGVREAAWPLIRDDLRRSYTQVGLLLSVPPVVGNVVEPALGVLGDVWRRRALVLAGGVAYTAGTLLVGVSPSFAALLFASVLSNPASGAFVGLSQAALMDAEPRRREQNMARWTLAGSLGNTVGPLMLAASLAAGAGWRWPFAAIAALMLLMAFVAARLPFPTDAHDSNGGTDSAGERPNTVGGAALEPADGACERATFGASFVGGAREAWRALRRYDVVRWLVLIELGNLTGDVLLGFLALYFVDVAGFTESSAAFALIVWTLVGLPADFLLIPLLERVRGLSYLRWSMLAALILLPAFLLAESPALKLVLLGLLGLSNAGWYAILKAQLYAAVPGRSATVTLTLANVSGLVGGLMPLAFGFFAQRYGLAQMMWLLVAGPLALTLSLWLNREAVSSE